MKGFTLLALLFLLSFSTRCLCVGGGQGGRVCVWGRGWRRGGVCVGGGVEGGGEGRAVLLMEGCGVCV